MKFNFPAPSSAAPVNSVPRILHAGPVSLKFADGELKYLYVGDHEIVRRIYFAVRNGKWATATPTFSKITVHSEKDSFTIELAAVCNTEGVDYRWLGHITGLADGTITFHATGKSGAAFASNRIGICVLYGTPAVTGKKYKTTVDPADGSAPIEGVFPQFVSPKLVAGKFNTLRHTTDDGIGVAVSVSGTRFDMEDQRTYGDSSFKAYAPLAYSYPHIPADAIAEETVTVSLMNALQPHKTSEPASSPQVTVRVGKIIEGARIPRISVSSTPSEKNPDFGAVNGQQEGLAGKTELTWSYTPSVHLEDNDVFLENLHVLTDQVRSVHVFAPGAKISLDPIVLNIHYKGEGSDPRGAGAFGAAWSLSLIKEMALAGVDEGVFATGPGFGKSKQTELAAYAGRKIYSIEVTDRPGPSRIDGFLVEKDGKPGPAYLINRSGDTIKINCVGWPGSRSGSVEVELAPYSAASL